MAIQLFMQATILLASYYHFETIQYAEIRERSTRAGFSTLPFMPPETIRATPELVHIAKTNNPAVLADYVVKKYGYKPLVKYYIRTGLRASQIICRNYLLDLEERNQYLEFLKREFGVAYGLASGVLAIVNANGTLLNSIAISRTAVDQATDIYRDYRFLSVDREAARVLIETAQNKFAEHFMKQVDLATPESTSTTGGFTFADALHAVSTIEYQCTREGIRNLLNRSVNNTPSNMEVDFNTGTVIFRSSSISTMPAAEVTAPVVRSAPPPVVVSSTPPATSRAPSPGPGPAVNAKPSPPLRVATPNRDDDATTTAFIQEQLHPKGQPPNVPMRDYVQKLVGPSVRLGDLQNRFLPEHKALRVKVAQCIRGFLANDPCERLP